MVDSVALDRFVLFGVSTGAPLAIRFAAWYPQRVTGLVLLSGFARGELRRGAGSTSPENFNALLRLIEDGWSRDNPAFRQLLTLLRWPGANTQQMESFNHLQRVSCTPQAAVALMRRDAEIDVSDDLAAVKCPTLVLHSPRDALVPFEEGRLIASSIRCASLEPFESPNHLPLLGEPAFEFVQRQIEEFLLSSASFHPAHRHRAADVPVQRNAAMPHTLRAVDRLPPTQDAPQAPASGASKQ